MSVNVPTLLQTVFRDVSMKTLSLVRTWPGKASFDSRNIAGAISNIRLVRRLEAVLDHRNIRPTSAGHLQHPRLEDEFTIVRSFARLHRTV